MKGVDSRLDALQAAFLGVKLRYLPAWNEARSKHADAYAADVGLPAGSFPVAERLAKQTLSLPMCPELTSEQIGVVTGAIREFFAGRQD